MTIVKIGERLRPTEMQLAAMRELLKKRGYTDEALAAAVGVNPRSAAGWRRKHRGEVYVCGWAEDARGRLFVPIWRWGKGVNVERPGPQTTAAERMQRLRAERAKEKR